MSEHQLPPQEATGKPPTAIGRALKFLLEHALWRHPNESWRDFDQVDSPDVLIEESEIRRRVTERIETHDVMGRRLPL